MTLVKSTCPRCAVVEVPISEAVLRVCSMEGPSVCLIRCPGCHQRFEVDADEAMVAMLLAVGVEVSVWQREPATERASQVTSTLTSEEVERFCELLIAEPDECESNCLLPLVVRGFSNPELFSRD